MSNKRPKTGSATARESDNLAKTPGPVVSGFQEDDAPESTSEPQAPKYKAADITVSVEEPPVVQLTTDQENRSVAVSPKRDVVSCRIGKKRYQFLKGEVTRVPASVMPFLREKGII